MRTGQMTNLTSHEELDDKRLHSTRRRSLLSLGASIVRVQTVGHQVTVLVVMQSLNRKPSADNVILSTAAYYRHEEEQHKEIHRRSLFVRTTHPCTPQNCQLISLKC